MLHLKYDLQGRKTNSGFSGAQMLCFVIFCLDAAVQHNVQYMNTYVKERQAAWIVIAMPLLLMQLL